MKANAEWSATEALSKVPAVTAIFWLIKIAATTLGETAGDAVSMSLHWGYVAATLLFAACFVGAVAVQIRARRFHPWIYWIAIIASTTVGTTMADFADRDLGVGYLGGSLVLATFLVASLVTWRVMLGSISVESITTPRAEAFYWLTIMFSQTLGTALGDWTSDSAGFGYGVSAAIFGGLLALIAAGYFWTKVSRTALFWGAFVLTRPLGAVLGDFMDKPVAHGGLALSRFGASGVLLAFIALCLVFSTQRASRTSH